MMKFLLGIIAVLGGLFGYTQLPALGSGSGTINQLNPWVVSGGYIKTASSTAGLWVPGLSSANNCLVTDSTGKVSTQACSSGGGGGGGGGGAWATTTNNILTYLTNQWSAVIGGTGTTSNARFSVFGSSTMSGPLMTGDEIRAPFFTATSTTATNTLPVLYSSTSTISNLNGVIVVDGVRFPKTGCGIKSAVTAVGDGGTILIPGGDYEFPPGCSISFLGKSVHLIGEGASSTRFYSSGGGIIYDFYGTETNNNRKNIEISGITFDQQMQNNVSAIQMGQSKNLYIHDCVFINSKNIWGIKIGSIGGTPGAETQQDIYNSSSTNVVFERNIIASSTFGTREGLLCVNCSYGRVTNNTFYGITQGASVVSFYGYNNGMMLSNNTFYENSIKALYIQQSSSTLVTGNQIRAVQTSGNAIAIYSAYDTTISNNIIDGSIIVSDNDATFDGHLGFIGTSSSITITGNTFDNFYTAIQIPDNFSAKRGQYDILISNNVFKKRPSTAWSPIIIGNTNGTTNNIKNVTITNNVLQPSGWFSTGAIAIYGSSTDPTRLSDVTISGNKIFPSSNGGGNGAGIYIIGASNVRGSGNYVSGTKKGAWSNIYVVSSSNINFNTQTSYGVGFGTDTPSLGYSISTYDPIYVASTTASSTFENGIVLNGGCILYKGSCLTPGGSSFGYPFPSDATSTLITFNGGIIASNSTTTGVSTTSSLFVSDLANIGKSLSIATTTITGGRNLIVAGETQLDRLTIKGFDSSNNTIRWEGGSAIHSDSISLYLGGNGSAIWFRPNGNTSNVNQGAYTSAGLFQAGATGTVSSPAFSFTNDNNTGLFSRFSDTLSITTGGVERMIVGSAGNIGIGTSTPVTGLHISTVGGSLEQFRVSNNTDATKYISMGDDFITKGAGGGSNTFLTIKTTGSYGGNPNAGSITLSPLGITNTTFNGNGFVGIGTTSPYAKLSVAGPVVGEFFTSTSTAATNTLPFLSSTGISTSWLCLNGNCQNSWPSGGASTTLLSDNNHFSAIQYFTNGLVSLASSTIQTLFSTNATSSTLGLTGVGDGLLKTRSGSVVVATAGTDYQAPLGAGTKGQVLAYLGSGVPTWTATTTFSNGLTYSSGNVTCNTASASTFGCLTASDWSTFNSKESPLTFGTLLSRTGNTISGSTSPSFAVLNATSSMTIGTLTGILKAASGLVSTASNGTDYTLITGTTCSGTDKVSAISASGVVTCSPDQTGGGGGAGFVVNATGTPGQVAVFSGLNSLISTSTLNVAAIDATSSTATSSIQRLSIGSIFQIASDWIKGLIGRGLGRAKDGVLAVTAPTATYVPQIAPVWADQLDSGWGDWYANGTVSHDTTVYREGSGSIKYVMAGGGVFVGMRRDIPDQNWTDRTFHISVRSSNWTAITSLTLLVSTEGTFDSFFDCDIRGNLVSPENNEWIDVTLGRSDCSVGAGNPRWDNVNQLIIRATASTAGVSLWADGLTVHPSGSRGVVSIAFDDGYDDTIIDGKAYMDKYGYKGTAYIIPDGIGTTGYMTQAQLEALHNNGWEVSMHGATNLTTLSLSELREELDRISAYRVQYGFDDGFAYPNGATNDQVISEIKKRFTYARNISFGFQSTNYYSPYQVNAVSPSNTTSTSTLFTFIDRALTNNEHLIITFHNLVTTPTVETEYSISGFREVIDYLYKQNATVLPVKQAMQYEGKNASNANRLLIGTSTSPVHRLLVQGTISGSLPHIQCPIPWNSQTAIAADQLGSATVQPFPCGGNYYFDMNVDGVIEAATQAVEGGRIASGTPMLQRLIANNTAGAGAGGNVASLKTAILGSATSSTGLIAEHWVHTPNVNVSTTSVTYIFGFSDVTAASMTAFSNYTAAREGCWIAASSTEDWKAVCRKNNVEYANQSVIATSTTPFKILYTLDQNGFNVYVNNDQTPRATIPAANIPVSYLRHFIAVGDGVASGTYGGSATNQGSLGIGRIRVWAPLW